MAAPDNSRYPALAEASGKQAGDFGAVAPQVSQAAGQLANQRLWQILATMFAGGALARGGLGAARLATNPGSGFEPSPTSQTVHMPAPGDEEEEKYSSLIEKDAAEPGSEGLLAPLANLTKGWTSMPASHRGKSWPATFMSWLKGSQARTPSEIPAYYPLAALAAAGGLAGGYGLTDKVLDSRRSAETETQLDRAKKRYMEAMSTTEKLGKSTLDETLDELADMCLDDSEKQAEFNPWGAAGVTSGGLMAYMLMSALASGKLSHDFFKSRGQASISEEALRRRAKERAGGVSPLQFIPDAPQVA